jgi:hypothetical protein
MGLIALVTAIVLSLAGAAGYILSLAHLVPRVHISLQSNMSSPVAASMGKLNRTSRILEGLLISATESPPVSSFQTEQQARRLEDQQARQASRRDTD